jgi:hypothetical protein
VVVDTDQLRTRPFGSLTGTVVNFADISNVALVFVDGALKKCRGRLVGADYQLIAAGARPSAAVSHSSTNSVFRSRTSASIEGSTSSRTAQTSTSPRSRSLPATSALETAAKQTADKRVQDLRRQRPPTASKRRSSTSSPTTAPPRRSATRSCDGSPSSTASRQGPRPTSTPPDASWTTSHSSGRKSPIPSRAARSSSISPNTSGRRQAHHRRKRSAHGSVTQTPAQKASAAWNRCDSGGPTHPVSSVAVGRGGGAPFANR